MTKYFFLLLSLVFIVGCTKTEATDSVTPIDNSENSLITSVTSTFSTDMLNAVNALRAKGCNCGGQIMPPVPALKWNPLLEAASLRHAKDMNTAKIFSHTGSDGSTMRIRIDAAGYRLCCAHRHGAAGKPRGGNQFCNAACRIQIHQVRANRSPPAAATRHPRHSIIPRHPAARCQPRHLRAAD